jgi:hypothetical protein
LCYPPDSAASESARGKQGKRRRVRSEKKEAGDARTGDKTGYQTTKSEVEETQQLDGNRDV